MTFPKAYFGSADTPLPDWRQLIEDDLDDNDESSHTASDVVDMLGFDPAEDADFIEDAFDPDEDRDDHGRWTSGGGAESEHEQSASHLKAIKVLRQAQNDISYAAANNGTYEEMLETLDQGGKEALENVHGDLKAFYENIKEDIAESVPKINIASKYLTGYHGTTEEVYADIMKHGLKPQGSPGGDVWAKGHNEKMHRAFTIGDRKLSVYFAADPHTAASFANIAAEVRKQTPMLLELQIPRDEVNKHVKPDMAGPPGEFATFKGVIKPEWIKRKLDIHQYLQGGSMTMRHGNEVIAEGSTGLDSAPDYRVLYAVVFDEGKQIVGDEYQEELHPRGEHGQWTQGSGGNEHAGHGPASTLLAQNHDVNVTIDDVKSRLTPKQIEAVERADASMQGKTPTNVRYTDHDGRYTPERAALHAEILDRMFSLDNIVRAIPDEGRKPILILSGGRTDSGKTTTFNKELNDAMKHSIYISADEIQEHLPNYNGAEAGLYNGEGQDIALQAEKIARDSNLNIIYDATLKSTKPAIERVQQYKNDGYEVRGYFVHTTPETSAVRSVKRFMSTGRYVPPWIPLKSLTNEQTFDALIPMLDKWAIYDNNGSKAKVVAMGESTHARA